jgi:4-hydroxybenzoate polyprenyltransferase
MRIMTIRDLRGPISPVYLAFAGGLCMYSVESYLRLGFDAGGALAFMGIIFGIYTLNRLTDVTEDFTNDIGRLLFYQRNRIFAVLGGASLAASFAGLIWAGKLSWLHWLLLGIGLGYSFRVVPWYQGRGLHWIRIKEILFVKNLSVAFLWGGSIFFLPIHYSGGRGFQDAGTWLLACGFIVCALNCTLFDDIVDEPGDRVAGIKTVPTVWGPARSIGFLLVVDALWIVSAVFLSLAYRLDLAHLTFLAATGLYPLCYLIPHGRTLRAGNAARRRN